MVEFKAPAWIVRLDRTDYSRLVWAFAISVAFHLLVVGTYQAGKHFGWWARLQAASWLRSPRLLTEMLRKEAEKERPRQMPLMFVDVSPAQAVTEPPKDAQFYSDKNSKAANPEPDKDTDIPKIDGKQPEVVKTEDVPFQPLQPTPVPEAPKPQPEPEQKAKPVAPPGDLALGKPEPVTKPDEGTALRTRPRTLQEANARKQPNRLPGQKMRSDGGVKRRLEMSSVDARATPFGAYDAALVEAISQRWFMLLDQRDYASDTRGKVLIHFKLYPNGSIDGTEIIDNSTTSEVLGILCRKAIEDPAPFAAWPDDMKRLFGNIRNIRFTFYYN